MGNNFGSLETEEKVKIVLTAFKMIIEDTKMTPHYHRTAKEEEADFLHSLSVSTTSCNSPSSATISPAAGHHHLRLPSPYGDMTRSEISKFNNNSNNINNGTRSDYGADTDCETHPPSDSEVHEGETFPPTELSTVLLKMEELNKLNEADARSITSRTASSDSPARSVGDASSSRNGSTCQQPSVEDEDEQIDLWTIWGNLVKSWEIEMKKRPNCVKELVRRGIPHHFRTITWQLLCNASAVAVHESYTEYLRHSSVYEKVIQRDMCRTYPELEFFKDGQRGQQSLFNVIKAYSVHDREVGYCQGSAFIVGLLLLQMPEEEAFAVFVKLMEQYRLRELYKPAMTELGLCMFQLECIVQETMSDLYTHFNNMGFDTSMYASSWFLTLFTTSLPLELANRIMDLFLVDGMSAIFRVAIAILQQSRIDLLKLDMEGMLKYFQREIRERYENDHELLFAVASQITLNAKKMKKLEKEYLAKRTKEQEEAIELRRLRTENRLLRQRIDYLEHESSALADRLIRGQVDLATQAENSITISHELHTLRDINSDAHRRLEEAYETIRELSSKRDGESLFNEIGIQVDDMTMIEHIHSLQEELMEAHTRKADLENTIRELKLRITELECANKRLKEAPPDDGVASIQEELIRVKMREAEASLSLKEMRQRLAELEQHWSKYANQRPSISSNNNCSSTSMDGQDGANSPQVTSPQHSPPLNNQQQQPAQPQQNGTTTAKGRFAKFTALIAGGGGSEDHDQQSIRELEEQLMGLRIKEADAVAELKEMRQKVMELETQNHVVTNQLKRQDEELKRIRDEKEVATLNEQKTATLLKEEQRKLLEAQGEMKEASVMQRLKYTESLQTIADLKQNISQLESKIAERAAAAQLRGGSIVSDMDDEFSHRSGSYGGDSNSIGSNEFSAFIADVTTKIPADFLMDGEITPVSVSEDSAIAEVKPTPVTPGTVTAGGDH